MYGYASAHTIHKRGLFMKTKRFAALFLTLAMLLGVSPLSVFASGGDDGGASPQISLISAFIEPDVMEIAIGDTRTEAEITDSFPDAVSATVNGTEGESVPVTKWSLVYASTADGAFSSSAQGEFYYEPTLAGGYTLSGEVGYLPNQLVRVGEALLHGPMLMSTGVQVGDFVVTGDTGSYSYGTHSSLTGINVLTITGNAPLEISMASGVSSTTTDTIVVQSGTTANLTLNGVNIDVNTTTNACAFDIQGTATANITLTGDNTLKSGTNKAGLQVQSTTSGTATLNLSGTGKLEANGGNSSTGIGGGHAGSGGNINILDGNVTANGAVGGAGIGGGFSGGFGTGNGGNITISGGTVKATGGANSYGSGGAGIGGGGAGGNGGTIKISSGKVTASGNAGGAGIGGGGNGGNGGTITISGGTIIANESGGGGAGIGGGNGGNGGTIVISDGAITAVGGNYSGGAAIGGGGSGGGGSGAGGTITISGGTITATGIADLTQHAQAFSTTPTISVPENRVAKATVNAGAAEDSASPINLSTETNYYESKYVYISMEAVTPTINLGAALTYDGTQQMKTVTSVKFDTYTLPSANHTLRGNTATNAGDYTLTVAIDLGTNGIFDSGVNYVGGGDFTKSYSIAKAPLTIQNPTPQNKVYDGTADATVTVDFTGLVNSETLASGTDYTVNANFASADVGDNLAVTGTVSLATTGTAANYSLADTNLPSGLEANITRLPIANAQITLGNPLTYNGNEQTQSITSVVVNGVTLNSADYTISDNTATDAGNYTLTLTGRANCSGTATTAFSVAKAPLTSAVITLGNALTYNGNEQTQNITSVVLNGVTLTAGSDYTVRGNTATNAGAYTLTVAGNGNYGGTATKVYNIAQKNLTITGATAQSRAYNGITDATADVRFGGLVNGETLTKGTDYTVSADFPSPDVGDNLTVGGVVQLTNTAKASNYIFSNAEFSFPTTAGITPLALAGAQVALGTPIVANGTQQTQSVASITLNGRTLAEGTDYTVSGNTATDAGSYTLTVTGKGNYSGTLAVPFTVVGTAEEALPLEPNGTLDLEDSLVPSGNTLHINPQSSVQQSQDLAKLREFAQQNGITGEVHFLADITMTDANGGEVQPQDGNTRIRINVPGLTTADTVTVLHIKDDGSVEEITPVYVYNGYVEFFPTSFSVYSVIVHKAGAGTTSALSPQTGVYG